MLPAILKRCKVTLKSATTGHKIFLSGRGKVKHLPELIILTFTLTGKKTTVKTVSIEWHTTVITQPAFTCSKLTIETL